VAFPVSSVAAADPALPPGLIGSALVVGAPPSQHPGARSGGRAFALAGLLLIGVGVVLRRGTVRAGWFLDDYVQHSLLDGNMWFRRGAWDLHVAVHGGDAAEMIRQGALPWWTEPTMVFAPLRPLTSLLMWWEYHHFGRDPSALLAVSIVLWIVFAALTLVAYARTLPRRAALLAAAVFVLSPVHAESVGWVASQSLLVSAVFGALSLNLYLSFRRTGALWAGAAHVITYACTVLGGEHGLAFFGFFCAYELVCARDGARRRLASVAPAVLTSVGYVTWSAVGGYGTRGVSYYVDVVSAPLHLLETMLASLPAHVVHGLAGPVVETGFGMIGWALAILMIGWKLLGATGLVARGRPAGAAGRVACAWVLGALLSTAPYGAASFSVRLGAIPLVGVAAVVGVVLDRLIDRLRRPDWRQASTWGLAGACAALFTGHLGWAGYRSHVVTQRLVERTQIHERRAAAAPVLGADGHPPPAHVFLMSAMHVPLAQTVGLARVAQGKPYALWRVLSPGLGPHFLLRTGERSFVLRTTALGLFMNLSALVYRRFDSALREGTTIRTAEMSVRVLEHGTAGPTMMEFTFDEPLESPRYRFVVAGLDGFEVFRFPPPDHPVMVPPALPPRGRHAD
jgi:hypothetical protein